MPIPQGKVTQELIEMYLEKLNALNKYDSQTVEEVNTHTLTIVTVQNYFLGLVTTSWDFCARVPDTVRFLLADPNFSSSVRLWTRNSIPS